MKPRIGFVGLGNIGFPMCRRLLESGYEVIAYDTNPEAVSRLGDTPAEPADSLKALAAADVVLRRCGGGCAGGGRACRGTLPRKGPN